VIQAWRDAKKTISFLLVNGRSVAWEDLNLRPHPDQVLHAGLFPQDRTCDLGRMMHR
jgi:hypothetical protein